MTLVIRPATLGDEKETVALWRACGLVASYNDPAEDFRFARGKENSDVLLGIDDPNKIVGAIMVGHDGHRGWVYYVGTDPACRLQNIGRCMIGAAEQWLRERKVRRLTLTIRPTNTQVVAFYEKIGFEITPRTVMAKWL